MLDEGGVANLVDGGPFVLSFDPEQLDVRRLENQQLDALLKMLFVFLFFTLLFIFRTFSSVSLTATLNVRE